MTKAKFPLPWQPIDSAPHKQGGDEIYVWNGQQMLFATWRYGWDVVGLIDTSKPVWCDGSAALNPQPTHWLPLSPPVE